MGDFVPLDKVYCTDVDLLTWASGDYYLLCPMHQRPAFGVDGQILASARWQLISDTNQFDAQGAAPGMVVRLHGNPGVFGEDGDLLAVADVSGNTLTMARTGRKGTGKMPGATTDMIGVTFDVLTLDEQIESASYEVNTILSIDPTGVRGVPVNRIYDLRELQKITAYRVLATQYNDRAHEAGDARDKFVAMAKFYDAKYCELKSSLQVRMNQVLGASDEITAYQARVVR